MPTPNDDVIAAIATPIGEGAISVIRVSGYAAFSIVDKIFRGRKPLEAATTHTAHVGFIVDVGGNVVDQVVVILFREPKSYTGENIAEINCHGGIYVTRKVLEVIIHSGARHAKPGEFTQRAFLNGKMDLSQAEAVADLIQARSEAAHHASISQLEGGLSVEVNRLRDQLLNLCSIIELELDFSEEDVEFITRPELISRLSSLIVDFEKLIQSYTVGRIVREGVKVVLAGSPNAGKSSIFNALLNKSRAIVTEIPGTTRDTIEENVEIGGLLFRLIDTAGIRESVDIIESEGIRRSMEEISDADIILFVIDATAYPNISEKEVYEKIAMSSKSINKMIVAINKIDLLLQPQLNNYPEIDEIKTCKVSALTGYGLGSLIDLVLEKANIRIAMKNSRESLIITNTRHRDAIASARALLIIAAQEFSNNRTLEFLALSLRNAVDSLSEIIGVVTTDNVLNNIFLRFCIGK